MRGSRTWSSICVTTPARLLCLAFSHTQTQRACACELERVAIKGMAYQKQVFQRDLQKQVFQRDLHSKSCSFAKRMISFKIHHLPILCPIVSCKHTCTYTHTHAHTHTHTHSHSHTHTRTHSHTHTLTHTHTHTYTHNIYKHAQTTHTHTHVHTRTDTHTFTHKHTQ